MWNEMIPLNSYKTTITPRGNPQFPTIHLLLPKISATPRPNEPLTHTQKLLTTQYAPSFFFFVIRRRHLDFPHNARRATRPVYNVEKERRYIGSVTFVAVIGRRGGKFSLDCQAGCPGPH